MQLTVADSVFSDDVKPSSVNTTSPGRGRQASDEEPTLVHLPPKVAGAALGVGLTEVGGSFIDPCLSLFVEVAKPTLVIAQVSPESPAAGLLSPGDVIVSINGIGGAASMTADAASNYIRSATTLKMLVVPAPVAAAAYKKVEARLTPLRLAVLVLLALLGVFAVGGLLFGSVVPWLRVNTAQLEAAQMKKQAEASMAEGRKAQRTLRLKERSLVDQIARLRHTAASNSLQANETMRALIAQQANITAQREEWHTKTRRFALDVKKAQQQLATTKASRDELQRALDGALTQLAEARRGAQQAKDALDDERTRAKAAVRAERERVRQIKLRLRQRAAELVSEADALDGNATGAPLLIEVGSAGSAGVGKPAGPSRASRAGGMQGGDGREGGGVAASLQPPGGAKGDQARGSAGGSADGSALVSREYTLLKLETANKMFQIGNAAQAQARPRYFSFAQVPAADVKPWLAGFDRKVKRVDDNLLLLFARTGKLLEQYRTVMLCLVPDRSNPKLKDMPAVPSSESNSSEFRSASFVGWNPWRNAVTDSATVSHNFGALFVPSSEASSERGGEQTLWGVGGQDVELPLGKATLARQGQSLEAKSGWSPTHRKGIYLMNASRLVDVRFGGWFPHTRTDAITREPTIDGHHPGVVEKRRDFSPVGQFDGKLSLARLVPRAKSSLHGRFFLYARANTKREGGGRFLQVATSLGDSPVSGWGPWQLLSIEGYTPEGPGNIYLATVKQSPFDDDMLLGLFAVNLGDLTQLAHGPTGKRRSSKFISRRDKVVGPYSGHNSGNTDGRSFIGLALSCNGKDWSSLQEISATTGFEGRTYDQPVDGLLVRGGTVSVLIHRDVYEISPLALEQSRIVRRELQRGPMRKLAADVRSRLAGCAAGNPYAAFD